MTTSDPKGGPSHVSQITVTVTVVGVDNHAEVFYTYTDLATGRLHVNAIFADVVAVVPYHTLFVLDYASTRNGWIFDKNIIDRGPKTQHWPADNAMSMVTLDEEEFATHRFYLVLHNRYTDATIQNDPQEGNVRQPKNVSLTVTPETLA